MSMEKRRDEIGKLLVCLLVSRKEASTIRDLEKDYRENEGRNIPYREFGCLNSLDFFRSISKHVRIEPRSGTYWVYPVVSDKIKHVNDLVSRQRPAKKHTPVRRRPARTSRYYPQVRNPKPFVPNTVQLEIAKILKANPNGVNKSYIAQRLEQSRAIADTVNVNNIDEYVSSMPYTAVTRGNLIYPSQYLKATINTAKREVEIDGFEMVSSRNTETIKETLSRNNNDQVTTNASYPAGSEQDEEIYDDDDFYEGDDVPPLINLDDNYAANINHQAQQFSTTDSDNRPRMSSAEFIHRASEFQHMQSQSQSQSYELPRQNDNAEENNCYQNGRRFEVNENREQEENCQDNNAACTFVSDDDDDDSIDIISSRIKSRLQQLIEKHPDGIWCADLPQTYLDEYNVPLDYTDLGYGSVCELASNIPKVFQLHRHNNRGDFMLYDASKPLPQSASRLESNSNSDGWENSIYDDDVDPFPMALPLLTSQSLVPKGVMTLGESVGQERIPEMSIETTEYLEIYVVEVYTPSLFWIHLRKKRAKLSQLMKAMDEFYREEGDNYTIPHVILEKGLNCVCPFEDKWHRAIIKSVKPNGDVTVIFYDYGTIKTCPPDALRFLVRAYSNLPAQAIACGLYNIKPVNANSWTRGVSLEFYSKVADTPLFAIVVKVDSENNSMLVSLTDTHEETDFHIDDWLVENQMAETGFMVRSRPSNFVFRYYLACTNYHYEISLKKQKLINTNATCSKLKSNNASSESKSELGSKVRLKSANYLKSSIMARCSKYRKESQVKPTSVIDVSAEAQGSSSTCVSKSIEHGSHSLKYKENYDRSLGSKAKSCDRRIDIRNEKQYESSSSISAQSSASSIQVSGDSNSDKASEGRVLVPPNNEDGGKLEFFGTFGSFYGGHGHMDPIDWDAIRNDVKLGDETDTKRTSKSQAIAESSTSNLHEEDTKQSRIPQRIDKCSDDLPKEYLHFNMISNSEEVTDVKSFKKKEKAILPIKDSFLNAVQSNEDHYYSSNGETLLWSPDGNIEYKEGLITPLLRTRKKCSAEAHIDFKNVFALPETLKNLTANKSQNKANGTMLKDLSDPDIDSFAQLNEEPNHLDTPGISKPSKIINIQALITPTKTSSETASSSDGYNCQSARLQATSQGIEENGETRKTISNTKTQKILEFLNSRKKRNFVDPISTKNSPNSNAAIDTNNLETTASSSVSLNNSLSSIDAGKKPDSQKDSSASHHPNLKYFEKDQKNSIVRSTQKSSNVTSSIKNSHGIISEKVLTVSQNVHSSSGSTDSERNSSASEIREIVSRSDDSSESKDAMKITKLNESSEQLYPTVNKIEIETSTTVDTTKKDSKILGKVSSHDTTIDNTKRDLEISGSKNLGKESSKSQLRSCIYSKLCESTASTSELDSDDLSCAYLDLENTLPRRSEEKMDTKLIKVVEPDFLDSEKTTATLRPPSSDDSIDIQDVVVNDNMPSDPDDEKEIEHYVSLNKSKFFSPIVNDVDSMAESDEWEIIGDWKEFMQDNGELMNRVVEKLQITNNSSEPKAQLVEITDKSELETAFYKNVHNCDEMENIREMKIDSVGREGSCDIENKNHATNVRSVDSRRYDSTKQLKLISNEKPLSKNIRTNHKESNQSSSSSAPIRALNRKKTDISIDENSDNSNEQKLPHAESSAEISKQNIGRTLVEERVGTRAIKSKTISMINMLENFKSKRNSRRVNSDLKISDDGVNSVKNIPVTSPVLEMNENVKSAIDTSTGDEISEELNTKESDSLSESGMFADLSNSSSSSKCSVTFIPNTLTENETDYKDIKRLKNRKSRRVLPEKYSILNQESQTSSSDAIVEFIEGEPTEPCAQFPILSRVKKQQLSVRSPLKDVEVGELSQTVADTVPEKERSLLNESSGSSSSLSKSLFDKIKLMYSKKN